ncbi:Rieske 2Fe-2S domain-containing protein [Stigmatella sp. ncwal1]|uniref:Rieske 2Fe-2S domain-containing protein n=1 Tax=Stigmatella ashevillensis TaxID=2995309 RepID=A0ABT5D034_9BACT|nr:Rieske 2Fe-2S domain-containing protein [Stigmatella ashevillena]MDC0707032.1 Rieske 2Fe-2S domain-containing protein [Stigmatella ashevillena]
MRITFIGHAGFVVETDSAVVVMDPWLSPRGAFDSAWMQLPRNHHLAPQVRELLETSPKQRFLYISHEHRDHFDPEFLETLTKRDFSVLIPRFQRSALRDMFQAYGCKRIISCRDGQEIPLPGGGYVKLFLTESGTNRDSGILVRGDGQSFLNLNDCKIHDRLSRIMEAEGSIDFFSAQFSGAIWHPTCYEYSREVYEEIALKKRASKFEAVARAIQMVKPRAFLAAAGPACFLDPSLFHLNLEKVNIFPRASELFAFLKERLPGSPTRYIEPMPGDVMDAASLEWVQVPERLTDENLQDYLHAYALDMAHVFRERRRNILLAEVDMIHEQLRVELRRKLDRLELHARVGMPLYMGLKELPGKWLRVDFRQRRVDAVAEIKERSRYTMVMSATDVSRVLERKLTWEELLLSFRHRMSRTPDVYEPILHAFLGLEIEDVGTFCEDLIAAEARRERTVVTAGGKRYSVQRFCPHQGADLTEAWIEGGRYLLCPRHRWQFDLQDGGRCATNGLSIEAKCLPDTDRERDRRPQPGRETQTRL